MMNSVYNAIDDDASYEPLKDAPKGDTNINNKDYETLYITQQGAIMAEYTRNDYLAGLQKANDAQDADAIKYFESKLRELDLFEGKQRAEEANDMGGVEYFLSLIHI